MADFLTYLYETGKEYTTVNVARSALSALGIIVDGVTVGSHPTIVRLLKGIFNKKPPRIKHHSIWDADIVLKHLKTKSPLVSLSLKELTLKLSMLIALTKAARPQTIHSLTIKNMKISQHEYALELLDLQKHNRPGTNLSSVTIKAFPQDEDLCVYNALTEYLSRTKDLRKSEDRLFISYIKPHKRVSRDTIRRWLHNTMKDAGINIEKFGPYSTRSASASKAAKLNIPIDHIMRTAGWSRSSTFEKFYHKQVEPNLSYEEEMLNISSRTKNT